MALRPEHAIRGDRRSRRLRLDEQVIDRWAKLLTEQAGDLVPATTITQEATGISTFVSAN